VAQSLLQANVPMVFVTAEQGKVRAYTRRGRFLLPDEAAEVFGAGHPFLNEIAKDWVALCHHPNAGDFVICGYSREGPSYVNVFLGRLNSFAMDNGLGSGDCVGEKATLASQAIVRELRYTRGLPTRQIGVSFRTWQQCLNLAGIDVITAPPKVARSAEEGKIPKLDHWADALANGSIGLDSLMDLAGLDSFRTDQKQMDDRVRRVLGAGPHAQS
jgi:hypothetical protein